MIVPGSLAATADNLVTALELALGTGVAPAAARSATSG